jgi:WD40 repeat protein
MSYLNAKYHNIETYDVEDGGLAIFGIAEKRAVVKSKSRQLTNIKLPNTQFDFVLSLRIETSQEDGTTNFSALEHLQTSTLRVGHLTHGIPPSVCSIFVKNIEFLTRNDLKGGGDGKTLAVYLADLSQIRFIMDLRTRVTSMDIAFVTQDGVYVVVKLTNELLTSTIH